MPSINLIKASDGTGTASTATVTAVRAPGASTILVDTVDNIPAYFTGTMGTPHTFTDPQTSETITVISEATAVDFKGHISSTHLEIDAIAPGFTDTNGSAVGDVVIIKPTTQWADNVADVLAASHNDDGTIKNNAVSTPMLSSNVQGGWYSTTATLTYTSWDSTNKTGVMASDTDLTGIVNVGARMQITQTTTKYFIVTKITSTAITGYFGTDYTLANAAITSPKYSPFKAPVGFPLDPAKWTQTVTSASTANLSAVWANTGSISLSVPIGCWSLTYQLVGNPIRNVGSGTNWNAALSESTTSVTSGYEQTISAGGSGSASASQPFNTTNSLSAPPFVKSYTVATTIYLIQAGTLSSGTLTSLNGSLHFIKAVCAYL